MKNTLSLFVIMAVLSAILVGAPEFIIAKNFLDKIEKEYGLYAKRRALALVEVMNEVKGQDDFIKMEKINDFFNQTPYASDQSIWGVSDYWATRLEFIGRDRGDCEDYVIAKYFTLRELGISPKKLYMTYVKSLRFNTGHMILTYYETPKSTPFVLDNYNYKILPATQRSDLVPVYSFSGDELFDSKQAQIGKLVPASSRQTRPWDELIIKLRD